MSRVRTPPKKSTAQLDEERRVLFQRGGVIALKPQKPHLVFHKGYWCVQSYHTGTKASQALAIAAFDFTEDLNRKLYHERHACPARVTG